MKQFNQLGIQSPELGFTGDKIKMHKILNREIEVHDFKVTDSKFENSEKCLHLQIKLGESNHVVFTGSAPLITQIQQAKKEDFPFKTTIKKDNDRYEFT